MSQVVASFLTRCFAYSETIALLLRREAPPQPQQRPQQRIVTLEQALAPRYLAWLAYENVAGANIYVSANPLRPGSRKRTKESIASRRSEKPDPLYYAQRTVDVASARLWLANGVHIDDVIAMLEVRRSFEIPAALCTARARGIAATAQRMIARRKTA